MAEMASIQVYLTVDGGREAIDFYKKAFGAEVTMEQPAQDGQRLMHASLDMFGGTLMLSDDFGGHGQQVSAPRKLGATTVTIHINLDSTDAVDKVMRQAVAHGATVTMHAETTFWGAYYGRLVDPFGHAWSFGAPGRQD